jgi:short-subunit dehydrogenase
MIFKKVAILGASRGLGRATALFLTEHLEGLEELYLASRKTTLLEGLKSKLGTKIPKIIVETCDLASEAGQLAAENYIQSNKPDLVIYSAGGGPYGNFSLKEWKDHHWALQMGLNAPLRLTHAWLNARKLVENPGRFIIVGSRIAESSPDFGATSYAASKHGLLGFVESLQPELKDSSNKVWLFSPGYINTDMLPPNAQPRLQGAKIMSVETAAQALLRWVKKDGPWHRVLN